MINVGDILSTMGVVQYRGGRYCISSQVLHTLTGTEDMTHGY